MATAAVGMDRDIAVRPPIELPCAYTGNQQSGVAQEPYTVVDPSCTRQVLDLGPPSWRKLFFMYLAAQALLVRLKGILASGVS